MCRRVCEKIKGFMAINGRNKTKYMFVAKVVGIFIMN